MAPVVAALWLALAAGSAWGYGYTTINPPPGGEASHQDILTDIYGGTWTTSNGIDFTNGDITALRVYDFNGGDEIIHVLNGGPDNVDQVWTDGTVTVTAEAKWAAFSQSFGWNGGGSGNTYYELLTETDIGGDPVTLNINGDFVWGTEAQDGSGYTWWSKLSMNESPYFGKDHMVTYFIDGFGDVDETVWLLFWEDYPCAGDEDFNDFVIQVTATIPEPSTALLLGAGLLALGLHRRRALS